MLIVIKCCISWETITYQDITLVSQFFDLSCRRISDKVADDNVQTSTWTRTLLVDTVTGEVKNPNEAWTANKGLLDQLVFHRALR